MPDGYSNTMRDHMADCYAAHGITPEGSEQLANNQMLENKSDQAMMNAYNQNQSQSAAYDQNSSPLIHESPHQSYEQHGVSQTAFGVPTTQNKYDSQPDSRMGNLWGNGSGTSGTSGTGAAGGNVWGPGDGSGSADQSSPGSVW